MKSILGRDPKGRYPREGIWMNATRKTLVSGNVFDDEEVRTKYAKYMDPYHNV